PRAGGRQPHHPAQRPLRGPAPARPGSRRGVTVEIVEVGEVTPALVEAFERLTPQLSKSNPPPSEAELRALVESEASVLLMAVDDDGRYVGTLTLVLFRIPTAQRAWIEDVI